MADYLATPILMIAATPLLTSWLGVHQYGIWMLANAISGTLGVFNMGLGDATIKYVSSYHARGDERSVVRVIRSTLTIYALLGGVLTVLIFFTAPLLVHYVFKIKSRDHTLAIQAIQLAGIGLSIRSIDSVFLSALRGVERYDLTAKVTMAVKTATAVSAVFLAAIGYGVIEILLSSVALTALGTFIQAGVCRRVIPSLSFYLILDRAALSEVFNFGIYSWIQSMAGMLFGQIDKLLIGAMLGTREVAYYTICAQLAQQIHSIPAAGFNFLFPLISRKSQYEGVNDLRHIYTRCLTINVLFALLLALPLVFLGKHILTVWMGDHFANEAYILLVILSVAFWLLSINVVPHNTLLGLGSVRFVAISNLVGGTLSLIGMVGLIPLIGINGAAAGRLFYGPIISINHFKVSRSL